MSDTETRRQDPYDLLPYGDFAWQETHPDHLAALAWLRGMDAPPIETARVLEIGCASGGNLLPMAASLPGGSFLGIDRSSVQIEAGQALQAEAGLSNIELRAADLQHPGDLGEPFDYILCHGLYSWLPPEARQALLALTGRHLKPGGVAYISANMLPGWHFRKMARDLMRFHVEGLPDPRERLEQARLVLRAIAEVSPEGSLHGACLRFEAEHAAKRGDPFLFHDQLAEHNEPELLRSFLKQAGQHGLRYLGDARPPDMVPAPLPDDIKQALDAIDAELSLRLQYVDFALGRAFRRNLLTPPGLPLAWPPDPDRLQGMHAVGRLTVAEVSGAEATGLEERVLEAVGQAFPASVAVEDLAQEGDAGRVREVLLQAWLGGALQLRLRPSPACARPGDLPEAPLMTRLYAARGTPELPTALHGLARTDSLDRAILPLLDGRHTRAAVVDALLHRILSGEIPVQWEGESTADPEALRAGLEAAVGKSIAELAGFALLIR